MQFWNKSMERTCCLLCLLLMAIGVLIGKWFITVRDLSQERCEMIWLEERIKIFEGVRYEENEPNSEMKEANRLEERVEELQPRLDPILRKKVVATVMINSKIYGLSPSLIIHLICRETVPPFNPFSKSRKDAIGLMQIMYKVHKKIIPELAELKSTKLYHIDNNIKFGCMILRDYITSSKNLDEALKKYVGGDLEEYVNDICRMMAEYEVGKYEDEEGT